ncbi:MAG: tetratricopeptide repeat protein, partial [Candidatus Omnitrophica bacterium]|nr:tetratricopeptide repeat protein [Candidatus Omnitrophota bacterium]
ETQKPDLQQAALAGMGKTSFARGNFAKALEYFKTAYQLKVDPKTSEDVLSNLLKSAYNLQDYKQLLEIYQKEQAALVTPQKSAEIRLIVAGAYALTKDYANANKVFDEILRNPNPTDEQKQRAVLGKVQNLILLGHADEALIILNEIPQEKSMFKDQVLYLLGEASMREGKSADALKAFDTLIRDFPQSKYYFEAFLIRGYVNLDMEKVNEARKIFHDFVKKFPDYPAASKALADAITLDVKMEDWKKGIEDSQLYLQHYPAGDLAQKIHYRLASLYSESGDYAKADAVYQEHVKKYAGSPEADISFYMGYNQQLAGKFAEAVAHYQKLDPAEIPAELHFSALKNSAYCYVRLEKFDEAAKQYRQIIAGNPANDLKPEVYFWLADYYVKKQDAPSVNAVLESFKLKPEAKEHAAELGYYLGEGLRIGKDYPGALQHYEAVIQRGDVFKANALYSKGLCSLEMSDYAAAIAAFEGAVKAAKDDHELGIRVRMDLAGAYARKGDMLEAAKSYFAVAILYDDPEIVPEAFFKAGDAFEKAGKAKEAAQAYRELVERYGKDPRAAEAKIRLAKIPQ